MADDELRKNQQHLNSCAGPHTTYVKKNEVTDEYIQGQLKATGRAVKIKNVGGGLLAIEYVENEEDLREVSQDNHGVDHEDELVSDAGTTDPWSDVSCDLLRGEGDEEMEELRPDTSAQEQPPGATGTTPVPNDQLNSSYQTRSKGAPRPREGLKGSGKKSGLISSTPLRQGIKGNWEEHAEEEDDEDPLNQSRGLNTSKKTRRKVESQRRKKEREKQQEKNRIREWSTRESIEEDAGDAEPGSGDVRGPPNPGQNEAGGPGSTAGNLTVVTGGRPMGSCLLYTSPSPRDRQKSRMPSSA